MPTVPGCGRARQATQGVAPLAWHIYTPRRGEPARLRSAIMPMMTGKGGSEGDEQLPCSLLQNIGNHQYRAW